MIRLWKFARCGRSQVRLFSLLLTQPDLLLLCLSVLGGFSLLFTAAGFFVLCSVFCCWPTLEDSLCIPHFISLASFLISFLRRHKTDGERCYDFMLMHNYIHRHSAMSFSTCWEKTGEESSILNRKFLFTSVTGKIWSIALRRMCRVFFRSLYVHSTLLLFSSHPFATDT